jgi:Holliday junction resolvase
MSGFSRQKGKRGERMLAAALTDAGFPARRGVQFRGGNDAPDIICPTLAKWHWESKLVETARIRDWLAQAEGDCGGLPWVIAWKRKHGPWLAVMTLSALLDIIREALPPSPQPPNGPKAERPAPGSPCPALQPG